MSEATQSTETPVAALPGIPDESAASRRGAASGADSRARRGIADRIGFWLFAFMVVLAPVPDGSVALIWIQLWTLVATLAVLLLSYRDVSRGVLALIVGLLVVLAGYGLVAWLQSLSPGPAPLAIWGEASKILEMGIDPLSSSIRNTPFLFLGRPLLAALVLTAAMVIGTDRRRAGILLRAIVIAACVYGLIGLAGLLFTIDELRPYDQGGALTTFFLNKNTTATYLGSAFLIVFALLLPRAQALLREHRPLTLMYSGERAGGRIALSAAGLFLLALLPLALSRAGLMLTLFVALAAVASRLRFTRGGGVLRVAIGIMTVLAFIYALSGESWRERQARVGFDSLGRLDAYQAMLDAAQQHPWLGLGLGSFTQSFAQFRTADLGFAGVFDIGHSTPIELIFEAGYPLALLVFAFVGACAAVLARGILRRPSDSIILAALLVGVLGLLHTSFDFPLQIPGFLIIYLTVVGMGLARSFLPREERKETMRRKVARRGSRSSAGPAAEQAAATREAEAGA